MDNQELTYIVVIPTWLCSKIFKCHVLEKNRDNRVYKQSVLFLVSTKWDKLKSKKIYVTVVLYTLQKRLCIISLNLIKTYKQYSLNSFRITHKITNIDRSHEEGQILELRSRPCCLPKSHRASSRGRPWVHAQKVNLLFLLICFDNSFPLL